MLKILDFLIDYGSLLSFGLSFTLILFYFLLGKNSKRSVFFAISITLLILSTMLSAMYLPMQIDTFKPIILYPISLVFILVMSRLNETFKKNASKILYTIHGILFVIGLQFLNAGANTWGNFGVWIGIFMTSNSILLLLLLTFYVQRNIFNFYGIIRLSAGIISLFLLLYKNGSEQKFTYDGTFEFLMSGASLFFSIILILEGALIIRFHRLNQHSA